MANAVQYNADDAGVLVQMADAANGNLTQTLFLPTGWDPLTVITPGGLGKPQAILAGGTLSNGTPAAVLAIGAPAAAFINYYTPDVHLLTQSSISGLLPAPPPPPPALPPPTIDSGFQTLYGALRSLIQTALTSFASSYPTLITCGIGGPGALAQLAAIDFRVDGNLTPKFLKAVACYSFSTPPFVNSTTATTSVQQQLPAVYAGLFAVTASNDFFPTAPTPAMGYVPLGQQMQISGPLPPYDAPWYERSALYYESILATGATRVRRAAAAKADDDAAPAAAAAGYDPDLAYVLAQFCAAASEAFQHSALSPTIPGGWNPLAIVSNSANQPMAVVYRKLSQVLVAFRGSSSFEETVQTIGNWSAQYVNFLPAPVIQPAGTVTQGAYNTYMALRQNFRQALSQISDLPSVSLLLTGHDSGGSVAVMAATDLMQGTGGTPSLPKLGIAPHVYTFGTPRMGNPRFAPFFTGNVTAAAYAVVRPSDVVANMSLPGYLFVGTKTPLSGTASDYDGQTYHPVISYIHLLNPRNRRP